MKFQFTRPLIKFLFTPGVNQVKKETNITPVENEDVFDHLFTGKNKVSAHYSRLINYGAL